MSQGGAGNLGRVLQASAAVDEERHRKTQRKGVSADLSVLVPKSFLSARLWKRKQDHYQNAGVTGRRAHRERKGKKDKKK